MGKVNRDRSYTWDTRKLVAWIQRRCIVCQRFLSKYQIKYCKRCYGKHKIESDRIYWKEKGREQRKIKKAMVKINE